MQLPQSAGGVSTTNPLLKTPLTSVSAHAAQAAHAQAQAQAQAQALQNAQLVAQQQGQYSALTAAAAGRAASLPALALPAG